MKQFITTSALFTVLLFTQCSFAQAPAAKNKTSNTQIPSVSNLQVALVRTAPTTTRQTLHTTGAQCDNIDILKQAVTPDGIPIAYTDKVLPDATEKAENIIDEMVVHLSAQAKKAIKLTTVVVYHCDPTQSTGQGLGPGGKDNYDRANFNYITLLPPKGLCQYFQKNPWYGWSWDKTYGVSIPPGDVTCKNNSCSCTSGFKELCATTTICDTNIACAPNNAYPDESILVHEFAHTIMNVGLANGNSQERQYESDIYRIYKDYRNSPKLCNGNTSIYSCSSAEEMWAEATQAWFHATVRKDVNKDIETPEQIKNNLYDLYVILAAVYGPQADITPIPPCNS